MATKPETTFYAAVHKLLPRTLHREKMSNPYRGGTPDVYYSGNKHDLWVEYKWLPRAPRNAFIPALSPLQSKWLRERHGEGRNVAVIIGCPLGVMVLTSLMWDTEIVPDFSLSRQQAADWIMKETQHGDESVGEYRKNRNIGLSASNSKRIIGRRITERVSPEELYRAAQPE